MNNAECEAKELVTWVENLDWYDKGAKWAREQYQLKITEAILKAEQRGHDKGDLRVYMDTTPDKYQTPYSTGFKAGLLRAADKLNKLDNVKCLDCLCYSNAAESIRKEAKDERN